MESLSTTGEIRQTLQAWGQDVRRLEQALGQVIVGQEVIVRQVLTALVCGGHVLIEGTPGLGKTLLVRTLSQLVTAKFSRIQCTPDLMPADITGTQVLTDTEQGRTWIFQPGPLFGQVILVDEINRATPKTQAALLEAMQEGAVTIGNSTHSLPQPFFVLATQNPLEMEGTYPLPEAQLDRFLLHILVPFPARNALAHILLRDFNKTFDEQPILSGARLLELRKLVHQVPIAPPVLDKLLELLFLLQPNGMHGKWIRQGPSPRAGQAVLWAAQATALFQGRYAVSSMDLEEVLLPALRHRILLSLEGQAEDVSKEELIRTAWQRAKGVGA